MLHHYVAVFVVWYNEFYNMLHQCFKSKLGLFESSKNKWGVILPVFNTNVLCLPFVLSLVNCQHCNFVLVLTFYFVARVEHIIHKQYFCA